MKTHGRNKVFVTETRITHNPRADGEGNYPPRLFTPGETKALATSKVHQLSWTWVTNDVGSVNSIYIYIEFTVLGVWSSSLISKIWRTVMNSGH
jgi:hypothetical protein